MMAKIAFVSTNAQKNIQESPSKDSNMTFETEIYKFEKENLQILKRFYTALAFCRCVIVGPNFTKN